MMADTKTERATQIASYQSIIRCTFKVIDLDILPIKCLISLQFMHTGTGKFLLICFYVFLRLEYIVSDRRFVISVGFGAHVHSYEPWVRIRSSVL